MTSISQNIDSIILAGGLGTRLRSVVSDRPKVLAPIGNKTLLDHVMDHLFSHGLHSIILSVGYMKEKIREHIERQIFPESITISFSEEEYPLGTGGAIKKALALASSDIVLILNGDTFFPIDYRRLFESHLLMNADITIGLRQIENVSQSGSVIADTEGKIIGFNEKTGENKKGVMSGGAYLFRKNIFDNFNLPDAFSIEKDFFEKHIHSVKARGLIFDDYFIDIGIPENYQKAKTDLISKI